MSDGTSIEWTDASLNPLRVRHCVTGKVGWHCEHKSEGCRFCYAEPINRRLGTGLDYKPGHLADVEAFLDEKTLLQPLSWKRPRRIFLGSMTDLFGDWVTDAQLDRIFAVMALCPQHTFQVLTKRPERMREYLRRHDSAARWVLEACQVAKIRSCYDMERPEVAAAWQLDGLPNVWLGVSCEDQATADERIPLLLQTPAAVRFISAEPLLGQLDLHPTWLPCAKCNGRGYYLPNFAANHFVSCEECIKWARAGGITVLPGQQATPGPRLNWVIAGGESGPNARPMHPDWARSLRDQCAAAGVAFFFKQHGSWMVVVDRDRDDPDWRADYTVINRKPGWRILNLAGGHGFHGERVLLMRKVKKAEAGRLLDGVEHSAFPQVRA